MGILWSSAAELPPRHLYNLLASILRALGDSRRPLHFLILAALLNIVLDLLLIIKFRMGAAERHMRPSYPRAYPGFCACSTLYGRFLNCILERRLEDELGSCKVADEDWIPMAFQFSITAIGTIVVQSALNMLGSVGCCRILGCQQDRAGGYPGLCGPLGQPWRPIVPRT